MSTLNTRGAYESHFPPPPFVFHCLWLHFSHHLVPKHCVFTCSPGPSQYLQPSQTSEKEPCSSSALACSLKALHTRPFGAKAMFCLATPSFLLFPDLSLCLLLWTVTRNTQEPPVDGRSEKAPKKETCQVATQLSSLLETEISNLFCRHVPFAWRQKSANSTRTVLAEPIQTSSIKKIPPPVVIYATPIQPL